MEWNSMAVGSGSTSPLPNEPTPPHLGSTWVVLHSECFFISTLGLYSRTFQRATKCFFYKDNILSSL